MCVQPPDCSRRFAASRHAPLIFSARPQPNFRSQTTFMYAWEDGSPHAGTSIFTPDNLCTICALEHVLLDAARYQEFCVLPFNATSASECKPPSGSVAYQFYANAKQVSTGVFLFTVTF